MNSGVSPADVTYASVVPFVPAWRVDRAFDYSIPEGMDVAEGTLVRVPFGGRNVRGLVVAITSGDAGRALQPMLGAVVEPALAHPPLMELLDWMARRYVAPRGRTFARVSPPRVRVKADPPGARIDLGDGGDVLKGYDGAGALLSAIRSGGAGTWLLQPSPRADKTALIGSLLGAVVAGGAALVLVPEVRYGSTVLEGLEELGAEVARVDSAQSEGARARALLRLAQGHPVGGGGRGAVLAPSPDLRLMVVDEEDHPSYKEDRSPRYDAIRVARERCRLQKAVCVLVSVGPSVVTGAAAARGDIGWVRPGRAELRAARPIVEVVDAPTDRAISHEMHQRVSAALNAGQRVALLVPRVGYANALWCASCRRSVRCPRCEAGLFFDRSERLVRCRRCGFSATGPERCPSCRATDFRYVGYGSQRIGEQVARAWPRATVARADPQTMAEDDFLSRARSRKPDIYVTTWIGTKDTVRPDVSLVGVLDADSLTRRPDFRASENAYRALVEMSEWAGPSAEGGRLVIQTSEPRHHAIQALVRADYGFFLDRELEQRHELSYPPFSELIRVEAAGPDAAGTLAEVREVAKRHRARALGPIDVGSSGALQLLLKCAAAGEVAEDLRGILARAKSDTRLRIDVDPH